MWAHALVLALVLLAGLVLSRPGTAYTSDEGAGVLQARLLDDTGSWRYEYPLDEIDDEGDVRPFVRGDVGEQGVAPYLKHPLYPLVLLVADRAGGAVGMVALSTAGTWLAAVAAALVARRLGPGLDRPALWVTGVASPLFFDGYLALAHTLAAAAAGFAVLAALATLHRSARWGVPLAAVAVAVGLATALRTEGALLAAALALAALVVAATDPARRLRAGAVGAAAAVGGAVVLVGERLVRAAVLGDPVPPLVRDDAPSSWVAGRLEGVVATWLDPSYRDGGVGNLLLVAALLFVGAATLGYRSKRLSDTTVAALLVVATACYGARLVVGPAGAIPGLLVAFPLLVVAALLVDRRSFRGLDRQVLAVTAGALVAGVLVTQYARGGGVEWGGRYFAIALPLLVPLGSAIVADQRAAFADRPSLARVAGATAVVSTVLLAGIGLHSLRHTHAETEAVAAALGRAARSAEPGARFDRPVVLAWNRLLPQILYPEFDEVDWVVPNRAGLVPAADRLLDAGVERVVLVTPDSVRDLDELTGWEVVAREAGPSSQEVVVLEAVS